MTAADSTAELYNNMIVTGAVWAALEGLPSFTVEQLGSDGPADLEPHQLLVRTSFTKSAYRISVERVPGTEQPDPDDDAMDQAGTG